METIEIKPMTSIEDAVKKVLEIAEQTNRPILAKFNGFLINSEYGYDKNIDLYFAYKSQPDNNNSINWERRRYEIAKEMLHDCVEYFDDIGSLLDEDKRVESSTELAIKYADALINKLKLRHYS